jgi:Tol biopolymer transport system component
MNSRAVKNTLLLVTCSFALYGCSLGQDPEIGPMALSPDGKTLVFTYSKGNSSHLFAASLSDGRARRLTRSDCAQEWDPVVSPAGDLLAFACLGHIFLAQSDGSVVRQLMVSEGSERMPKFSPDGLTIYFAKYRSFGSYSPIAQPHAHEWDVFATDLTGKNIQQLTDDNFYGVEDLSISPDGKEFLVSLVEEKVLVYPIGGRGKSPSPAKQLTLGRLAAHAQYTLDGKSVLYMYASDGQDGYDYDVYRMNLQTETREKLTSRNGYATGLRVAPDGRSVAFLKWSKNFRSTPVRPVPYILDLETRKLRKLALSFVE